MKWQSCDLFRQSSRPSGVTRVTVTPVSFRDGHALPDTHAPLRWPQQKVNMRSLVSTLPGLEASTRQQRHKHWTPDLTWDCCSGGRSLSPLGRLSSLTGTRTSELLLSKAAGTWVHCGPMVMGSRGRATRRLRANVWPTSAAPRSIRTPAAPPQPGRVLPSSPGLLTTCPLAGRPSRPPRIHSTTWPYSGPLPLLSMYHTSDPAPTVYRGRPHPHRAGAVYHC